MTYHNGDVGEPSVVKMERLRTVTPRIMDMASIRRFWGRNNKLPICYNCEKLISVGDIYYFTPKRKKTRRYHWKCAEKVNLV